MVTKTRFPPDWFDGRRLPTRPEIVSTKTTIEEDTCLSVDHIIRFSSWNKLVKGMTFIKRSLRFRGKEDTSGTAKGSHEVGMEIMKDA